MNQGNISWTKNLVILVRELINKGADLTLTYGHHKFTALIVASAHGRVDVVKELASSESTDISMKDTLNRTAFGWVIWIG